MIKKTIIFIAIFLILPFFLFGTVFAQTNFASGKNSTLQKDEVIEDNYFASGETVDVYGTVKGDAYLAGGNVTVDGDLQNDLLVAGGNVKIEGNVAGDIRVAGGQVNIDANVGGNVTTAGGTINFSSTAKVAGSVVSAGGNISIDSPIGKTATLAGGNIVLGSSVGGNTQVFSDSIRLSPEASIKGDLNYWTSQDVEASIADPTQISGNVTKKVMETPNKMEAERIAGQARRGFLGAVTFFKVVSLLSFLLIGFLLLKLYPTYAISTSKLLSDRPWASLGVGFLTLFISPIAFIALLITVIGIPFALIGMALLMIFAYMAKFFAIFWVGQKLLPNSKAGDSYKQFLLGFVIFAVLVFIPIIAGLTKLLALLFGLGAMLISCKSLHKKLQTEKLV